MFEREFGAQGPLDEDGLRAAVEALESERVDIVEARIDFWRWGGLPFLPMLTKIGKARQAWAIIGVVALDILLAALIRSPLAALACLLLLVVIEIYQYTHFVGWIEEHNARVDERIRDMLERTRAENR